MYTDDSVFIMHDIYRMIQRKTSLDLFLKSHFSQMIQTSVSSKNYIVTFRTIGRDPKLSAEQISKNIAHHIFCGLFIPQKHSRNEKHLRIMLAKKLFYLFHFYFICIVYPKNTSRYQIPNPKRRKKYKKVDLLSSTGRQYQEKSHR